MSAPGGEAFVLDLDSNPHPRLLAGAQVARREARWAHWPNETNAHTRGFWAGYLRAMADATGTTEADLNAWLDRHEAAPAESHAEPEPGATLNELLDRLDESLAALRRAAAERQR